jgi:DNA primase
LIKKEDIDKIFDAVRIEEVVADHVSLKKRGVNLIGCCPFHNEKTPSFYVSPVKGIYKCFGCGKGGHAVNFIMELEKLSYPDALRALAKKYNIEIVEKELTPEETQYQSDKESLLIVSSFAQKHFSENLYNTDEGKSVGLGYFKERGLREDIIQKFQLGYSINHRTAFTDIAIATGYKIEYLVKSGLTIEYRSDPEPGTEQNPNVAKPEARYADRFWGRVMFPIHNKSGRVIAFGGRTLRTDAKTSKYVNSPETEIYHKSDVLYGLYQSKNAIAKEKFCFLVEGYLDVISLHQAGVENVVASSGTALTAGHIKEIQRLTNDITISFDGDKAGIEATIKSIDLLLEEGMNVKVLLFPDGDDPDSYSKKVTTDELKTFIRDKAQTFIAYKAQILTKDTKNDPLKKAEAIVSIVKSIALIPEAIYRSVYIRECSRIMEVDEQILLSELNKFRSKLFNEKKNTAQGAPKAETVNPEEILPDTRKQVSVLDPSAQELDIIRLLITYGNKNITIQSEDDEGKPIDVEITTGELIIHELQHDNIILENLLYNEIYNEIVTHFNHHHTILDQKHFINHENLSICKLTVDILTSPYQLSDWEQHDIFVTLEEQILKTSIYNSIYALKAIKIDIMKEDLREKLKMATSEEEIITLVTVIRQIEQARILINKPLGRIITK